MLYRRWTSACLLSAALLVLAAPTYVIAEMPEDMAERVRAMGRTVDPPKTATIYAQLHEREPYQGFRVMRDLKYGPDDRQALDVFVAEGVSGPRPVFMFVHGGAFVAGTKRAPGSPFYDNIMLWAARGGLVGVNVTYRVAPKHPWPMGAQDVGAAVRWVAENIGRHGGDSARVFLAGHSAGAAHVAEYVAHPQLAARGENRGLRGAILLSGIYDITTFPPDDRIKAYYGSDEAKYPERRALPGLLTTPLPLLVTLAELDPPPFEQQAKLLNDALCKANRCPAFVALSKHNHMSTVYAVNTKDIQLADALLAFVRKNAE